MVGEGWERLTVTVPLGKALMLKVKGVACPEVRDAKEERVERVAVVAAPEKDKGKKKGNERAERLAAVAAAASVAVSGGSSVVSVLEARTWLVVTGFSRYVDGRLGAAEASKQLKPLDVLVAVNDSPLAKNDFLSAARALQQDETEAEAKEIKITLWRNNGAVAPAAEGWVPLALILEGDVKARERVWAK